jgi:hypothetical protein
LCKHGEYDDGSTEMFAVPELPLSRDRESGGIARIVAREWQNDGYLKPGRIVRVYPVLKTIV